MKNWKNNRGSLVNKDKNSVINENEKINHYHKKLLKLYELYFYLNKEIKIKRIVNHEFKDIIYINDKKIKKHFKWEKH